MFASALVNPTIRILSGGIRVNEKAGMGADDLWLRPGRQGPDSSQNLSKACLHHGMTGTPPALMPLGLEQGLVSVKI